MDLIVGLPMSEGFNAIWVVVDRLTKYVLFVPTTSGLLAEGFAELFVKNVACKFGIPEYIITDRDPRWTSEFWRHVARYLRIEMWFSSSHHPQHDGQTEVANKQLEVMLRSYVSQDRTQWAAWLHLLQHAHNSLTAGSTGYSPYFLLFGFQPRDGLVGWRHREDIARAPLSDAVKAFVDDLEAHRENARLTLAKAQDSQARAYNRGRRTLVFRPGDLVLINPHSIEWKESKGEGVKLGPKFIGPFPVQERVGENTYRLDLPDTFGGSCVLNIQHLSAYQASPAEWGERASLDTSRKGEEPTEEFQVEKIVGHRFNRKSGATQFLVRPWIPARTSEESAYWPWLFGRGSDYPDVQAVPGSTFDVHPVCREKGLEVTAVLRDLLLATKAARKECSADPPRVPVVPRPPFPSLETRLSPADVERAVNRWRLGCLDLLGFLAYVLHEDYPPFDFDAEVTASSREAARFYVFEAPRRGVFLNLPDYDYEIGTMKFCRELWLKAKVPFAYPWKDGHGLLYDDAWDPFLPGNYARITNPFTFGQECAAIAEEFGSDVAFLVRPGLRATYDLLYFYEDYADAKWKVNLRVYYADCPRLAARGETARVIGPSPRTLDLYSFKPFRSEGPSPPELMAAERASRGVSESPVNEQTTESGSEQGPSLEERLSSARSASFSPPGEEEPAAPPRSRSPSTTEHKSAHPHYERFAPIARAIIEQACADDLLVRDDLIPDVLPSVSIGVDDAFMQACVVIAPPPTTLCFLAHYMEGYDQSLGDLCAVAVRSGMPFRLTFSTEHGEKYSQERTAELQEMGAIPPSPPSWAAPFYGDLLSVPKQGSAADYRDAYFRGISYITSLPHYARLFTYGGLIWRLAIAHLAVAPADHPARRLLCRPSDAWALYRVGAELNANTRRFCEAYAVANQDPLVRTLLGVFSNGQSFWPPQEIFLSSFRWWGQWSPLNEAWFQQRKARIEAGTERPKAVYAWSGAEFTRAPGDMRSQPCAKSTADQRAEEALALLREEGVFDDTIFGDHGEVYATPL
ncbi:hypothetical protein PsYK624_170940 [Phanerochaete sordida]|uniref:Integrase catalytic domain-containing protein n=1 Tax=Phanerochaete sordida TaxID=48140 RepID=A0A9P3GSM3_9APHY|nr:hypothetical protein PsYK624_170940 [Phanerochaete sordida]